MAIAQSVSPCELAKFIGREDGVNLKPFRREEFDAMERTLGSAEARAEPRILGDGTDQAAGQNRLRSRAQHRMRGSQRVESRLRPLNGGCRADDGRDHRDFGASRGPELGGN